jgi:hypothetical protein
MTSATSATTAFPRTTRSGIRPFACCSPPPPSAPPCSPLPAARRASWGELHFGQSLGKLYGYCRVVADYGCHLQPLDLQALKGVKDEAVWEAEMESLRRAAESWYERASRMMIAYAPATKVWQRWLQPEGIVHDLLAPVRLPEPVSARRAADARSLAQTRQEIEWLAEEVVVRREVDRTDRRVLGRRGRYDIVGKAYGQIRMHLREALDFAQGWLDLEASRPGSDRNYQQPQAERLRREIWSRQDDVLRELDAFEKVLHSVPVRAGLVCCRGAVKDLKDRPARGDGTAHHGGGAGPRLMLERCSSRLSTGR